jgi:aldose 1-epimerase
MNPGISPQTEPRTFELSNSHGDRVRIMNLGGIVRGWEVCVDNSEPINIVLGYPHWRSYFSDTAYHGAIVGRYCNRIAAGRLTINGRAYQLVKNEGGNHLHGGHQGFHRQFWQVIDHSDNDIRLSLTSPDGDQGYPGNLKVLVRYSLDDSRALIMDWEAKSDTDSVVSLTSHGYFNLAGSDDIRDHHLRITAPSYTPVDAHMIPTGKIASVEGSIMDLRNFSRIGDLLDAEAQELTGPGGLDHNWAWQATGELLDRAALFSPSTNLRLTVSSTLPGLQCYTGNALLGSGVHGSHEGICLEPQYYPDSPNHPAFPSPLLKAGEVMRHRIRYRIEHATAAVALG